MTRKWTAIAREAALSAEHLGIGVTALGKANYAFPAYYSQAFFALSIGLERSCKLALAVNHALSNHGQFPSEKQIRAYGHDLRALISSCDEIARDQYGATEASPSSMIHRNIIDILNESSTNITRYYNVQVITNYPDIAQRDDPIHRWHDRVIQPILRTCCKSESVRQVHRRASIIDAITGSFTMVMQTAADGSPLTNVLDASTHTGLTELSTPFVRLHVLQIARPIAELFSRLGDRAQADRNEDIPCMSEFFTIFMADDRYFRTRKVWSTYPTRRAS